MTDSNVNLVNEHEDGVEVQEISAKEIDEFNAGILEEMFETLLRQMVNRHKPQPTASYALQQKHLECSDSFRKVNMITLCCFKGLNRAVGGRPELFSFVVSVFEDWQVWSLLN